MPWEGEEVEVELEDGLEQQDEVDGTKTFAGVKVVVMQRLNCADVIYNKLFSLERIEVIEHSSAVYCKI